MYANLRGTNLRGAVLTDTNLYWAEYSKKTSWPKGFDVSESYARLVED